MKRLAALALFASLAAPAALAEGVRLTVRFANPAWNGVAIPPGQQCAKLGGQGASPALNVYDLPAGTAALQVEFSERGGALDNGGHGVVLYTLPSGATNAQVPSVPGEQAGLPGGFQLISAQRGGGAGAYLPPCNKGSRYVLQVKALDASKSKVLGEGRIDLGKL